MSFILISGNGSGAGKTYLQAKLANSIGTSLIANLADALRNELAELYPSYNWFAKDQYTKENTLIVELNNITMRKALIEHGQKQCQKDPDYWCKLLIEDINKFIFRNGNVVTIISDVRKASEVAFFKTQAQEVLHFHIESKEAHPEPFENLRDIADYIIVR